jgi:hypothetical protein
MNADLTDFRRFKFKDLSKNLSAKNRFYPFYPRPIFFKTIFAEPVKFFLPVFRFFQNARIPNAGNAD